MINTTLPSGLSVCQTCGETRGTATLAREDGSTYTCESVCLCDGLVCQRCGAVRCFRPTTDNFNWRSGRWEHTAWFGYRAPCPRCDA
jgi:hypothetical protein